MYEFFTIQEVRKQGVGQKLYTALVDALKENECELIFLTTLRDSAAYKLYLKNNLIDLKDLAVMIGRIQVVQDIMNTLEAAYYAKRNFIE